MEELWDLEEAWLAGNDPSVGCRVTRSVAGRFFDMYCVGKNGFGRRKKKRFDYITKPITIWCTSVSVHFNILRNLFRNSRRP